MKSLHIRMRLPDLLQGVVLVDDGFQVAGFDEFFQAEQVVGV